MHRQAKPSAMRNLSTWPVFRLRDFCFSCSALRQGSRTYWRAFQAAASGNTTAAHLRRCSHAWPSASSAQHNAAHISVLAHAMRQLRAASAATAPLRRALSLFPTSLPLSVPQNVWARALASPALMNPTALCSGLPRLVTQQVYSWVPRTPALPRPPTLAQIDARLRRCMDAALQTYHMHALPPRLVILNALHLSGRKLPYLATIFMMDQWQRHTSQCLQPVVVTPASAEAADAEVQESFLRGASWWQRVQVCHCPAFLG